jgi:hypothetical protein
LQLFFVPQNNNSQKVQNSILLQLWCSLSKRERIQLRKWLQSPVHNQREDTLALFNLMYELTEADLEQQTKSAVFERLFPGKAYDNDALNYVYSFLTKQIEAFIAWEEITKNEDTQYEIFIARALRQRGVTAAFERKIAALEKSHAEKSQRNAAWHLLQYEIRHEKLAYQSLQVNNATAELGAVTDALTQFFLLENIRLSATALSRKSLFGNDLQVPLSEEALKEAQSLFADPERSMPDAQWVSLEIVWRSFQAQHAPEDEQNFQRLKTLLAGHTQLFDADEYRDFYRAAINFALRRHNRGERPHYTSEALGLYREALEKGFLFESGRLPPAAYNNINRLAGLLEERDFALDFLERYAAFLPTSQRENVYRFNLAIYHYLRGDYRRVPDLLQAFEFTDVYMNLHAREMLLKSYFELEEWQALASLCDSFYTYLRRKKDLGYHRTTFLNLIKYIRKAMKPGNFRSDKAARLAKQIRAEEYMAGRDWLLEKMTRR